jgi:hypothetical protein
MITTFKKAARTLWIGIVCAEALPAAQTLVTPSGNIVSHSLPAPAQVTVWSRGATMQYYPAQFSTPGAQGFNQSSVAKYYLRIDVKETITDAPDLPAGVPALWEGSSFLTADYNAAQPMDWNIVSKKEALPYRSGGVDVTPAIHYAWPFFTNTANHPSEGNFTYPMGSVWNDSERARALWVAALLSGTVTDTEVRWTNTYTRSHQVFGQNDSGWYLTYATFNAPYTSILEIKLSGEAQPVQTAPAQTVTVRNDLWVEGPPTAYRIENFWTESEYRWVVPSSLNQKAVSWVEIFTPADNPNTAQDESANSERTVRTWTVTGPQSPVFQLNPTRDGNYSVALLDGTLAVDANRNGKIALASENTSDATSTAEPFRFWLNDDDDDGDLANQGLFTGNSDEPGKLSGFWELDGRTPDHAHAGVDGRCDLLDFFPVYLDIKQLLTVLPTTTAGIVYKLKQADAALNFVYTDLSRDHANTYQTNEAAIYGTNFDKLPHMAETTAITAGGVTLSTTFLEKIKNGTDKGVILVEGVKPSDKPLRLVVEKGDVEIAEMAVNIKISEVEKMYRWVNLRGSLGQFSQSVTRSTDTCEPANYPDARTNSKMFIWVHGYNVNEQQSRAWAAEGFKRLFQSGSRAMYTFVSWHGDHSQIANSVAPDYWDNITNAFRTSQLLPGVVAALPGTSKIITGHSMGNVVVGSAIVDHGLKVTKYFMLNAAMALEAYDTSALNIPSMRRNEWASYDSRLWSTEWYQLFPSDGRAGLTWKNRFGDITNAINFYSSGEEVLNNNDTASGGTPGEVPVIGSERAWVGQEMIKGTYHIGAVLTLDIQSGWDFNSAWDIAETTTTYRPRTPTEAAALTDAQLRTEPFFRRFQDDRLMTSGGGGAAGEYITRADALGGAIPALSFPAGRNPIPLFEQQLRNTDLIDLQDGWPQARLNDPKKRISLTIGRWFHSDAKNIAYRYNYKLWDTWVGIGGLK